MYIALSVGLVAFAAIMAGLTVALMSLGGFRVLRTCPPSSTSLP